MNDQISNICSTPPGRMEAFEEFKRDEGSEINRILTENKGIVLIYAVNSQISTLCHSTYIANWSLRLPTVSLVQRLHVCTC